MRTVKDDSFVGGHHPVARGARRKADFGFDEALDLAGDWFRAARSALGTRQTARVLV